jgi:hypothetical protein
MEIWDGARNYVIEVESSTDLEDMTALRFVITKGNASIELTDGTVKEGDSSIAQFIVTDEIVDKVGKWTGQLYYTSLTEWIPGDQIVVNINKPNSAEPE